MARKNCSVSLTTLLPSLNMWMLWVLAGINSIPLPGWDLIYLRLINMTWSFLQQWLIRVTFLSPWLSNVIPQLVWHLWVLFCSYWKRLTHSILSFWEETWRYYCSWKPSVTLRTASVKTGTKNGGRETWQNLRNQKLDPWWNMPEVSPISDTGLSTDEYPFLYKPVWTGFSY